MAPLQNRFITMLLLILFMSCKQQIENKVVENTTNNFINCGLRCWLYDDEFLEFYNGESLLIKTSGKGRNHYLLDTFIDTGIYLKSARILTYKDSKNTVLIDSTFSVNIEKNKQYYIRISAPILNEFKNNRDSLDYYFIKTNKASKWETLPLNKTFRKCELLILQNEDFPAY